MKIKYTGTVSTKQIDVPLEHMSDGTHESKNFL